MPTPAKSDSRSRQNSIRVRSLANATLLLLAFARLPQQLFTALVIASVLLTSTPASGQFQDKSADLNAMPRVPPEFQVSLFAREPLVRQPCSMAFDRSGRMFVGMGPQYRKPKPETPGDSVVIVLDTDGDGKADQTKVFATGFNAIQGLAWHGRDLWGANAPDLTVVRDLNGDDEADEYVKLYTDLGNLEHGLHGLNWAPDGKLYMSKGNSKGLNQSGRYAPKPFRDLWGLTAPSDVPDFPKPVTTNKADYRHAYHKPSDDWGMDGGVLRCDDGGHNLEIVSRGFRNPWDITMDSQFNWLGTDNDQNQGDRVFMPFFGAHFGWNHPWSSHWSTEQHAATAPVSGPLFQGSGTGVIFCMSPQFPSNYRGAFLINDWLSKTTYVWRPEWDGALMRPAGGKFTPFIEGGSSLFRPTDLEFGPDGALWVLGWSSGYGAEWENGQLSNEGRIFRVSWNDAPPAKLIETKALQEFSVEELITEFDSPLPVRRIDAQVELVRRGPEAIPQLLKQLESKQLTKNQETWTIWSVGRIPNVPDIGKLLLAALDKDENDWLNRQVQAVRILSYRWNQFQQNDRVLDCMRIALEHSQARVRFAAVQAIHEAKLTDAVPQLLSLLERESDTTIYYAGWQALRRLASVNERRALLTDSRPGVRRASLLSLLETHELSQDEVNQWSVDETSEEVRQVADFWALKMQEATGPSIKGRSLREASGLEDAEASTSPIAAIRNVQTQGNREYQVVPGGFHTGNRPYVDRSYRLTFVPPALEGCDMLQTANSDESTQGDRWLTAEALVPIRVWVGIDQRQDQPPSWLADSFEKRPFTASIDEGATLVFYERTYDAGTITLGGNTNDGCGGSMVNYLVAIAPVTPEKQKTKVTSDAALASLASADPNRGEVLFRHSRGVGCYKCHSLNQSKNGFGPNLANIGARSNAKHIVQSIVDPSAIITEGFNQQTIVTDAGKAYSGVLLEESGLAVSLGQSTGLQIDIPKSSIEERSTNPISAMPDMTETLTPQQVADLAAFLLSMRTPIATDEANTVQQTAIQSADTVGDATFRVEKQKKQLRIFLAKQHIADFVFADDKIRRPFFANARVATKDSPNGMQITRNHPPVDGVDQLDHQELHPGIFLAFGDINGEDFWRNKAAMEHVRFLTEPTVANGRLHFVTECRLNSSNGDTLGSMTNEYTLSARPNGWLLVWSSTFRAGKQTLTFGDQEEMGFGARVATPFTEKNGGLIRSSSGKRTAKQTWGQAANWCDYSGPGPKSGGIMLMASPDNFRQSWWHNRNYGVFVANPFGRKAMKQGKVSSVSVAPGESLRITFGALIHDHQAFDAAAEYATFKRTLNPE